MKKLLYSLPVFVALLFTAACGNDSDNEAVDETQENEESTDAGTETSTETQTEDESSNTEEESEETTEDASESDELTSEGNNEDLSENTSESDDSSETGESEETSSAFSEVSDSERDIVEQRFRNRTNDDFISSIETQNDEYSALVVYVNPENLGNINEEGLRNKLEGIGTSIREMTSGILYDNAEGTLPELEFRNSDDEVLGTFDSHDRNQRMEFRP